MENKQWKEYLTAVFGSKMTDAELEKVFLANPADAFAIYQLREHESTHDLRFLPMSQLQAAGLTVERANYEVVYVDHLKTVSDKSIPELLEGIYYRFNMEHPDDFYGHSLSVSDVVALKIGGVTTVHFVDRYGWQELHGFLSDQPLRNVEMLVEDDYGMIDGIINNGKREPERERSSVAEQLRKMPTRKPRQFKAGKDNPVLE